MVTGIPHHLSLSSMMAHKSLGNDAALIVVDMQEDFCEPHGALAVKGGRELATGINRLLELPFKLKIATQDHHPADHCSFASQHQDAEPFTSSHTIKNPEAAGDGAEEQTTTLWPDHCIQGTKGADLIPELDVSKFSQIIKKGEDSRVESYSAFGPPFRNPAVDMSDLKATLEHAGIKRVYTCGLAFDFCVKYTAIDAVEAGFDTYLIEDLTNSVNARNREGGKKELVTQRVHLITAAELTEGL
ncbi:hypothetical protein AMS68_004133 [Peltaster fructicola]|uniref:nicotinamidase n=1 Tax=Peltaster fructicola TaxID=286661 RepID=A0A6H0XVA2_9PEZI|nr:hypothetical protein AMS68_004133 [Peltaster fructicola]